MIGTRVHAVIEGLLTLVQTALPAAQVLDGPRASQVILATVVVVGFDPVSGAAAVARRGEEGTEGAREEGEITLTVIASEATFSMSAARARVVSALQAIEAALVADATIGGSCHAAWLGPDLGLVEYQTPEVGAQATLATSVQYRAWVA